ncbi:MAG: hypothetical protein ACR2QI_10105 [Woeseiaceae bacterium]
MLLIVARFIWAEEAARLEDGLFEAIGLAGGAKYLITVPLAIWVLHRMYKREQSKAAQEGKAVVRPQVLVISFGLLVLAIALLVFSAAG